MALHPRAHLARVSFERYLPTMTPRAVFLHTNGGGTGPPGVGLHNWWETLWSTAGAWGGPGQGIGSTFQVYQDGEFDQYVDSTRVIFAQFQASRWSGSIETQDNGNPATPWTDAQMAAIIDILAWYNQAHGVPLQLAQNFGDPGIYYHEQFAQTNFDHHACPGTVRERQLLSEIIPSLGRQPHTNGDDVLTTLPTITPGDPAHGDFVDIAVFALQRRGWPMPAVTGAKDPRWVAGIKVVQGWAGLSVDGVLGPQTWQAVLKTGPYAKLPLPSFKVA